MIYVPTRPESTISFLSSSVSPCFCGHDLLLDAPPRSAEPSFATVSDWMNRQASIPAARHICFIGDVSSQSTATCAVGLNTADTLRRSHALTPTRGHRNAHHRTPSYAGPRHRQRVGYRPRVGAGPLRDSWGAAAIGAPFRALSDSSVPRGNIKGTMVTRISSRGG